MIAQNTEKPVSETASILVVEDNPDSREALRALLEAYGFKVYAASDGLDGVEQALQLRPDLILMDIMMPVMDGLQATRTLRSSASFRQVPIVALTALSGSREIALEAGCSDYLTKPFNVATMLKTIQQWLQGASEREPS